MSKEDTLATLIEARALIARPGGWTKGRFKKPLGRKYFIGPQKYAYCALGALQAADGPGEGDATIELSKSINNGVRYSSPEGSIAVFNDHWASQKDVVALFDKTIERVKANG